MKAILLTLWHYRAFVWTSITNEFKIRFARSKLGALWLILQPLSQVLIYAVILSAVLSAKLPGIDNRYAYALYLMSGTLCWSLFQDIILRLLSIFVEQANLIKKMQFPKIALPTIAVGTALINNLMLFTAILLISACIGHFPTAAYLYLPVLVFITICFATGIGLVLGIMNVFLRDLAQVIPIMMQLLFWATPIVYPISIIPPHLKSVLMLNPLFVLVSSYQDVILFGKLPSLTTLGVLATIAALILGFGMMVFRRASAEMADVL